MGIWLINSMERVPTDACEKVNTASTNGWKRIGCLCKREVQEKANQTGVCSKKLWMK